MDKSYDEHSRALDEFILACCSEGAGRIDEIKEQLMSPAERQAQAERSAEWQAEVQRMTPAEIDEWLCERIRGRAERVE